MKKILILGGSHRDIPLIKASQELGYKVTTLGNAKGYLGHKYADNFHELNFNDLDKVRQIIKDENIDYLIPGSGEESYINTVKLSEELNIGNFDSVKIAKLVHNKWLFKEFCLNNQISTPNGFYYASTVDLTQLNFPIVVKPTNLSGGRGVEVVNNYDQLNTSIEKSLKISDEIFLEEFIEGDLIAYSIIIENQKIIYDFIAKDDTYLNPYLITTAYPYKIKNEIYIKIKKDIEKLSKLLNLVNGMFHLQIILKEDKYYIIDVTRRIPGDFFPDLMEHCDEISYTKAVIQAYTVGKINKNFLTKKNMQNFIIRHCIMPTVNGKYKDIHINETIKRNIISKFDLIEKNSMINNYLHTQIAILFIKLDFENDIIIKNLNNLIKCIVVTELKENKNV